MGGMTWHHLQYFIGLYKLGHDVYFLEDSGDTIYSCYDPVRNVTDTDATYGLNYAYEIFNSLGLVNKWCYFNKHKNLWEGPLSNSVMEKIRNADALINLSCSNPMREWFMKVPARILVDTDPVFTQIRNLTDKNRYELSNFHNSFFTFGENFGKPDCGIPNDGFLWRPTRQPVVLDLWKVSKELPSSNWTTVMQWDSYSPREYNGISYGMKSHSFNEFKLLPELIPDENFELAIGGEYAPVEELKLHGWKIVNSLIPAQTPESYKKYIESSKGEWSIAKDGYIKGLSGWFSERSVCYLASGKPVIVQDTGFSGILPIGRGLFAFTTIDDVKDAILTINNDYHYHCMQARKLVIEFFDSDNVLNNILKDVT